MPEVTRIPTEIWHKIIVDACIDGGFTGRSLALASKFFHSQSLSARFHSLALDSLPKIEGFLLFLRVQPEDCKPKVQHLYLALFYEPATTSSSHGLQRGQVTQAERMAELERRRKEYDCWQQRLYAATQSLLAFAAPTVRTLCVVERSATPIQVSSFPRDMPRLEELTWMGEALPLSPYDREAAAQPPIALPALKRVHLMSPNSAIHIFGLCGIGPSSLSHLRISVVGRSTLDRYLPRNLAAALEIPKECFQRELADEDDIKGTLPHLRHVLVHAIPSEPGSLRGSRGRFASDICADLRSLGRACEERIDGARILVLEGNRPKNLHQWLREDWVDRMQGGQGCWVEFQQDEAARANKDVPESEEHAHVGSSDNGL
ncbi:hypothetical protein OH77DRAFT_1424836 [Trametes cingulata]|nr:hypothetical protein OH77DRAFT_1424836 [Trametes cingulata]